MNIRGLTVCVNYGDLLRRGLDRWHVGLDRLVVVTSPADKGTQELCDQYNVEWYATDIFYANGAKFNKAAAMAEAIKYCDLRHQAEWLLMFDADIVPPKNWREQVENLRPQMGFVHGAKRWYVPENISDAMLDLPSSRPISSVSVIGFFMLFHTNDPRLGPNPIFDLHWPHAGNYDTVFARKWPSHCHRILPIQFLHLGEERVNWTGRGKKDETLNMLKQRRGFVTGKRFSEDWQREAMVNPPTLEKKNVS
jgi:hypothetical protein